MESPGIHGHSKPLLPTRKATLGNPQGTSFSQPQDYDVVVIGGGPQGAAIAYDLATRQAKGPHQTKADQHGLKVLLLEKNDIGAGTSAYSSRLIHGGLRYLRYMNTKLVRESLRERERLFRNAPHLVHPLPFALPLYPHSKYGPSLMKIGMVMYDLLSFDKSVPKHRMMHSPKAFLEALQASRGSSQPILNPDGLKGGAIYYDGQVELPERLCLENALAAQETGNAEIRNHADVTAISPIPGNEEVSKANRMAAQVHFRDVLTGEEHTARAKVVINAAGPWVDELIQRVDPAPMGAESGEKPGIKTAHGKELVKTGFKPRMGGTKGSHIIIRRPPGMPTVAFYSEAKKDQREFFILPWRNHTYLIGTTDIRFQGNLDKVVASEAEINYLIEETNHVLRLPEGHRLTDQDVLYHYAGVRPLPWTSENQKTGSITRSHKIEDHGIPGQDLYFPGFVSIEGGKLTTARSLAEEASDYVIQHYQLKMSDGQAVGPSKTDEAALPGAKDIITNRKKGSAEQLSTYKQQQIAQINGLLERPKPDHPLAALASLAAAQDGDMQHTVSHLIDLYGSRYDAILALAANDPQGRWQPGELLKPLYEGSPDIGAQVVYAVRHEMARTVEDVMLRRVCCGLDADLGMSALPRVADLMAKELGWDEATRQQQMESYRRYMQETRLAHLPRTLKTALPSH
ncbi:MAG TPA: glycerol-3-phosphate dehydrogenase/oxidase [Coleofasciculaceae cyanobacterium]|jgi:glycerol-3-phosphate dehydrogenase